jgi:nitrogen fixation/metabolism regulation signal transduction histidine kinase
MLRQVLHNLLQNAQDALSAKAQPMISVKTEVVNNLLVLTVEDNGAGFPTEMLARVFEPYMTTKPHGTGLGLAIVKKIIEEHKGTIKIENIAQPSNVASTENTIIVSTEKTALENAITENIHVENAGAIITISIPLLID